jgi:hypothetical protein
MSIPCFHSLHDPANVREGGVVHHVRARLFLPCWFDLIFLFFCFFCSSNSWSSPLADVCSIVRLWLSKPAFSRRDRAVAMYGLCWYAGRHSAVVPSGLPLHVVPGICWL